MNFENHFIHHGTGFSFLQAGPSVAWHWESRPNFLPVASSAAEH